MAVLFLPSAGSPFKVPVHDVTDASKVKCSGPGLSPGMVRANLPQSFQVDTSKAGVAPLQVKVQGPKGECSPAWEWAGRRARSSWMMSSTQRLGQALRQFMEGPQATGKPVAQDRGPPGHRTDTLGP